MGLGERIRIRRMELGLSRGQLAERLQITPSSVANYENGISCPKPDILISLLGALETDANYLFQDYISNGAARNVYGNGMSEEEAEALEKYRKLTDNGKAMVRLVIDAEYQRTLESEWVNLPCYIPGLRKLNCGFIMQEHMGNVRVKKKAVPDETEFCFQIRINRFEPVFQKFDILALNSETAQHNEMGIFRLNGICYFRILSETEKGRSLIALNVIEPPIEVGEEDDFACLGRVLGKIYGECELEE